MVHRVPPHAARTPHGPWLLDDQAQSAAAFLTAFEHTGDGKWLDRARELTDMMLAFYWDDAEGGFFDAREVSEGFLSARGKPIQDAPTSSPNAVAALTLLRLAVAADEPKFRDRAQKLLAAFAGRASELSIHGATYLRALDWLISGECKVVVADATTSNSLAAAALAAYRPRKIVVRAARSPVPGTPPPIALVCAGTSCAAPVNSPETLLRTLESFARSG